jgi:hypothetical protein
MPFAQVPRSTRGLTSYEGGDTIKVYLLPYFLPGYFMGNRLSSAAYIPVCSRQTMA